MTDQQQHPITPPPKLIIDWCKQRACINEPGPIHVWVATEAARWGADQELEACIEWQKYHLHSGTQLNKQLRAARRPKPPSLKESALNALEHILRHSQTDHGANTIRRALEALPE
jgi:hypothetical protein